MYSKYLLAAALLMTGFVSFSQAVKKEPTRVEQMAVGNNHCMVLLSNGTIWGWGSNAGGQVGDSTTVDKEKPVKVGNDTDWAMVTAGGGFTHAVKKDGSLWGWGINKTGQLGISTANLKYSYISPVRIGKDNDWKAVSSGASFTVGLKNDGTIWVWGSNMYNLVHDANNFYEPTKLEDKNNKGWVSIAAGDVFFVALKDDGTLWSKGMINNTLMNKGGKKVFFKVSNDSDWKSIEAGRQHAMALKKDGTLWAWGVNNYGQLGNGTNETAKDPVKLPFEKWASVAASADYTVALRTNGEVWSWGKTSVLDSASSVPFHPAGRFRFTKAAAGAKIFLLLNQRDEVWEFSERYKTGREWVINK